MYIHEYDNWTDFQWDNAQIALKLDKVTRRQGMLYGKLNGLCFDSQLNAMAENLTRDLLHSSEIEGKRILRLDAERYERGDLSKENLLAKYCSYFVKGEKRQRQ